MYTRREFGMLAIVGLPVSAAHAKSQFGGVRLGVGTYSYRELPPEGFLDAVVKAMKETGLSETELFGPHANPEAAVAMRSMMAAMGRQRGQPVDEAARQKFVEARKAAEEQARKWHMTVSLDHFKKIRKQFNGGGIQIYAYNGGRFDSDEEIERSFQHAKALGATMITWSGTLGVARNVARFADRHKMIVAVHGHSNVKDPEQFATPESFTKAMAMSKYIMVNLDLGHYVAAGFDPIAFMKEHHARIPMIHLKDRKKNQGPNTPFGEGDTPIREALQLIRQNRWPVRAYIEYEYAGKDGPVAEVKKCFEFAKAALA